MQLFNVLLRTIFFYFFIVFAYRIMGKREVGQLGIIDLIVSILIAELVAISIENSQESIIFTIIPIGALVGLELILGFVSIKSRTLRNIFGGKPALIIANGKINYKELVRQRYALDDLMIQLRLNSVKTLEDVEYAFLEPNGQLSIFKYNFFKTHSDYPIPVIVDGQIQNETLKRINKSKKWLKDSLAKRNIELSNVFYAFYHRFGVYVVKRSDLI